MSHFGTDGWKKVNGPAKLNWAADEHLLGIRMFDALTSGCLGPMATDARWEACAREVRRGGRLSAESIGHRPIKIQVADLRQLLIGFARSTLASDDSDGSQLGSVLQIPVAAPIHIDGGKHRIISIVADEDSSSPDPLLDFTDLCNALGGALPPLTLRNCVIEGWLDFSGSHFSSVTLSGCNLRGIRANGCQIDGDCHLTSLAPLGVAPADSTLEGRDQQSAFCQVIVVAARIDGSVDLRDSLLRAPVLADHESTPTFREQVPSEDFALQFALSLASSEIRGRVQLLGNFEAWGGISLYQTEIRNSVRITSRLIAAHEVREFGNGQRGSSSYAAVDASEMRLEGSLLWSPAGEARIGRGRGNVYGNVDLVRASIGGDLSLQNLRWAPLCDANDGRPVVDKVHPSYPKPSTRLGRGREDERASGGIDGRFCRVGGQLHVGDLCRLGRRYNPSGELFRTGEVGPSVDFWKATFELGVRLDIGSEFHGPVLLNGSHAGRHIFIASSIWIETHKRPRLSAYHTALDLSDVRLDGNMVLRLPRVDGRATLQRMHIDGSMDIQRLHFNHRGVRRAIYLLRTEDPATCGDEARRRERFDETSIFDAQDLVLSGGVNLKRDSISVEFDAETRPHNNFIVDLRGMSCTTWDDADSTCWAGLNVDEASERVPWRLRFEGIAFRGLENSTQHRAMSRHIMARRGWWEGLVRRFYPRRSFMVASSEEVRDFRIRALNSFHENRNRNPAYLRPEGPAGPGAARAEPGLARRIADHVERWTISPSWKRREQMPPHSPQPYEVFARAYMARGEGDAAIELAMERMRLQWRKRLRTLNRYWGRVYLVGAALGLILLPFYTTLPEEWSQLVWGVLAFVFLTPLAIIVSTFFWRHGFGYGLHSGRALVTVTLFLLVVAFGTPAAMQERIRDPRDVREHLIYALDKLVPVMDLGDTLYPPAVCIQPRTPHVLEPRLVRLEPTKGGEPAGTQVMEVVDTDAQPSFHAHSPSRPCLSRDLDRLYEFLGWLILSLTLLTLSGLLRRDVERSSA